MDARAAGVVPQFLGVGRDFCAACGTPLTFRYLDAAHMEVTIGSLDDPAAVPPLRNFGTESRLAWVADLVPGRLPDATDRSNWRRAPSSAASIRTTTRRPVGNRL